MLAVPVFGQPGPELIPQERERRDLMIAAPINVLAVDDPGLARMQFQADFGQAGCDRGPLWRACFSLAQCTTASSQYRSNRMPGCSRAIQASNA